MAEIQAGIIPGGQDIRLEAARVRKRYLVCQTPNRATPRLHQQADGELTSIRHVLDKEHHLIFDIAGLKTSSSV